jgi:hypothetical protein
MLVLLGGSAAGIGLLTGNPIEDGLGSVMQSTWALNKFNAGIGAAEARRRPSPPDFGPWGTTRSVISSTRSWRGWPATAT